MTFQTARYASASAAVCARDGVSLGSLDDAALVQVQREIGAARRALDVLAAEVAGALQARADAQPGPGGIARRVGYRNVNQLIADTLGSTGGEAHRNVAVGKMLAAADAAQVGGGGAGVDTGAAGAAEGTPGPDAPRTWSLVAAAVRDARITVEKAEILTSTLATLRASEEAEGQFVRLAERLRPYDLRRVCAREIALNDPEGAEAREKRHYDQRTLTLSERMDGMTVLQGLLDPASAGHLKAWLDAQVRAGFQAKRETPGDVRTAPQMRVDALAMLARHAIGCEDPASGVKTTMVVRMTLEQLQQAVGVGTCDSLQTPISLGTLRAMAADAQVIPVVMGADSVPLDVGYAKRLATPYQRVALGERDGGCAWCHAPASYCDTHHVTSWENGGRTDYQNLVMLCVSCHHLIHFGGWRIEVDGGVVWFTPPASIDPTRTKRKGGLADLALAA